MERLNAKKTAKFFALCAIAFISAAPAASASETTPRETYAEGRQYMREGKWKEALEIFKPLEDNYTLLGDYVLFDIAACYEKSGAADEALTFLRKIASNYKKSPLYRKAYNRILEIGKDIDITAALTDFDLYLGEFPRDSKILWEKTEILEKLGREAETFALWKELFFTGSPYTLKAYEVLRSRNYQPSYEEIKKVLYSLMEKGNYGQAVSLLEGIAVQDEEGKYLLGRAYFRLRRYPDAVRTLSGVSFKDGKYLLALSLIRANEKEAFYKLIEEVAKEGNKDLFSLHIIAAEMKRREGNISEAGALLQSLPALYPEKKEEIIWSQAWLAIRQKRVNDAEKLLRGLISYNSDKRDKYFFWLGKVKNYQGQKGDDLFSQIKDKNGYYWFQSGRGESSPLSSNSAEGLKTEPPPSLPGEMNTNFLRITELHSLKMKTEARIEAELLMGSVTVPYISAFARLLVKIEDYCTLVKLGIRYDYPSLKYPLAFPETVKKYAQSQKLDPLLVMAVMREESHFQHDAVSEAGALGVMQLMPSTARGIDEVKRNEELFDVEKNIRLGTNYLSRLLAKFKLPHYALAAYNAGEHNAEKWLAAGYRDEAEFTEDIPFSETKNYVFRIMKTYGIMKALYGNNYSGR
ncbi:MAG TPA: transglycosylase SLT domain-containing protein [Syntrophales bacterium]|nr:transglycosylase SLT domain-containing protein [Syntrophales bacterium]